MYHQDKMHLFKECRLLVFVLHRQSDLKLFSMVGLVIWSAVSACVCLYCPAVKPRHYGVCGSVWDRGVGGGTFEDTVSFSCEMFSCMFLFGEAAAHCSQKLAGNHMLLTLELIRGEGLKKRR